jgi:hypothetical protein
MRSTNMAVLEDSYPHPQELLFDCKREEPNNNSTGREMVEMRLTYSVLYDTT